MVGLLIFRNPAAIIICIAVFGFASRYRLPATTSVSTEIKENDPEFAASAYALMYAVGSVIGVAAPPLLSVAAARLGMERAMLCFSAFLPVSVLFSLFLRETGPGKLQAASSAFAADRRS
jgi:hypothetical protein